jgi:hypothetical protein
VREVTSLEGVEDFTLSPDERKLLVRYSALHAGAAGGGASAGGAAKLTDTRSADFKAREWIQPQDTCRCRRARRGPGLGQAVRPGQAGTRQKVSGRDVRARRRLPAERHQRYPVYFREQMFHNLLVQKGYIVLDMDYRASKATAATGAPRSTARWATRNWKTTSTA